MKSEGVGLIVRAISFQDFQHMWSWSTNVTDRQTDRQTDRRSCNLNTALCTKVHCAVKTTCELQTRCVNESGPDKKARLLS